MISEYAFNHHVHKLFNALTIMKELLELKELLREQLDKNTCEYYNY